MRYKTAFRLVVKAIGLYVALFGMFAFLDGLTSIGAQYLSVGRIGGGLPWYWWVGQSLLMPLLRTGVGTYLFFRGKWIVNLAIPSNRPYCPQCAYELTGAPVNRCPECGTSFRWEDVMPPETKDEPPEDEGN